MPLRALDRRHRGDGPSGCCSPRVAAKAAQTSPGPTLKDEQLVQNRPQPVSGTVALNSGPGRWLGAGPGRGFSVVGYVIHQALHRPGRGMDHLVSPGRRGVWRAPLQRCPVSSQGR